MLIELLKKLKNASSPDNEVQRKNFTQNLLGMAELYNGYFFMTNGQIIGIVEIIAMNFDNLPEHKKFSTTEEFKKSLRIFPDNLHFKVHSEKADINNIIMDLKRANVEETNPAVLNAMKDCINNIKGLQGKETYCKKFYVIYEYEGDSEHKKSNDKDEIVNQMNEVRTCIIAQFMNIGNMVVIPTDAREVLTQPLDIVYKHFNPNSSRKEPLDARIFRLRHDEELYNKTHTDKRHIYDADYAASRGFHLLKNLKDTYLMDGIYHTHLILNDNGYPIGLPGVYAGWILNLLEGIDGIDIDVITKKKPHDVTLEFLKQHKKLTISFRNRKAGDPDKTMELDSKIDNSSYIISKMKEDEDFYEVVTIITIRADTLTLLRQRKNTIVKTLKQNGIYVTGSYRIRIPLFRMTMPFFYVDSWIFKKYSHEMLTSGLCSFYWYSTYELMDEHGCVLGINTENSTLVAFNNFLKKYVNPHILLLGTSGAGKTFTEQALGRRMRLLGRTCVFIIPSKGSLDYAKGCKDIGGTFIRLGPLQKNCINIMEIRPEEKNKTEKLSLLAKKVNFLIICTNLLLRNEPLTSVETSQLNVLLLKLYEEFGITEDNESILDPVTGKLKEMPIIEDMWNKLKAHPTLYRIAGIWDQFVNGNCQNMNQQTNVDLNNKYIVFDVDEDSISEILFPFFLFIAFDCGISIAKRSTKELVTLFLDEVWKLMKSAICAAQVKSAIKLLRAYNSSVVVATQDIEDFLNTTEGFGKSVLTNSAIRILLKLTDTELEMVSKCISLSDEDKDSIEKFSPGRGMILANGDKIKVWLRLSEHEMKVYEPDDAE